MEIIQNIDWSILHFIQNHIASIYLNKIMVFFTTTGNVGAIWVIIALALMVKKKYRFLGIMILVGLILELIIGNMMLKNFIARPRPCWIDNSVNLLIKMPKDYSFPSGHTFASFVSATIVYMYNKKWGVLTIVLAALISFSRLYLFVHFPSDVIAGAILGVLLGIGVYKFFMTYVYKNKRLN